MKKFALGLVLVGLVAAGFYLFNRRSTELTAQERAAQLAAAILPNDMLKVAEVNEGRDRAIGCVACHNLERTGPPKVGPSFAGLVGRGIASQADFVYSEALLKHREKTWTTDELDAFLHDPQGYAPGTLMTFTGMLDPQDRMDLIKYLMTL